MTTSSTTAPRRLIRLRTRAQGYCAECGALVRRGVEAYYDPQARQVVHTICPPEEG